VGVAAGFGHALSEVHVVAGASVDAMGLDGAEANAAVGTIAFDALQRGVHVGGGLLHADGSAVAGHDDGEDAIDLAPEGVGGEVAGFGFGEHDEVAAGVSVSPPSVRRIDRYADE
jgi:hypothetical protein